MDIQINDPKCCDAKHLPAGEPNSQWGAEDLGRYAANQHKQIVKGEKSLTAIYWLLGLALQLARPSFTHGQWLGFLKKWEIDTTRASRARAIHQTFGTTEATAGLSVKQAYAQRRRKQPKSKTTSRAGKLKAAKESFSNFLKQICDRAEHFVHEAAVTDKDDALKLLEPVAEAICRLSEIQEWLKSQTAE